MDSIVLSPKELLVLASKMGAKRFYGIQDPFRGMTQNEIRTELPEIQLQLEKKGLAMLGFDHSFALTPMCEGIISVCILCEQYIAVDSIVSGTVQPKALLYFRDGEIVFLHELVGDLELRRVSSTEAATYLIRSGFSSCTDSTEEICSARISQSLLSDVRNMESQVGVDALSKNGCSPKIAQALVMGLHQECGYTSLVAVDFKDHTFKNVICVIAPDGNLRLIPDEEENIWQATWVSKENVRNEVEAIIKGFALFEEGKNASL